MTSEAQTLASGPGLSARDLTPAWECALGELRLTVSYPHATADEGPRLGVYGARAGGREWLRFDCHESGACLSLDPEGRREIRAAPPRCDAISWAIESLAANLSAELAAAGAPAMEWNADELRAALHSAEEALRNPPVDLADLDVERLHERISEKWSEYPADVLPAWVAEMDFPLAQPIRRVLARALANDDVGYPLGTQATGIHDAFAERMQSRFGWSIDPARVEVLSDVVQGMYIALEAYSERGEGAVVQTPIYPPFLRSLGDTGRRLVENRLVPHAGHFEIDFDALEREVDASTRIVLLCNPHNPTGRVLRRHELERLAQLACERDLVAVADEIHGDLVYPGHTHIPFATLSDEAAGRTVTLTSATKAFNIPGLCCCLAHFGSPELQARFNDALPRPARGALGLLGLYATVAAWRHSQPWLDSVRGTLVENRRFVGEFLRERIPAAVYYEPEATYLAWIDFAGLELATTPALHFLQRGRVALSAGPNFGAGLESFARLNFATSRALLSEVLERVAGSLDER